MKKVFSTMCIIPIIIAYYFRKEIKLVFNAIVTALIVGSALYFMKTEFWVLALPLAPLGFYAGLHTAKTYKRDNGRRRLL